LHCKIVKNFPQNVSSLAREARRIEENKLTIIIIIIIINYYYYNFQILV